MNNQLLAKEIFQDFLNICDTSTQLSNLEENIVYIKMIENPDDSLQFYFVNNFDYSSLSFIVFTFIGICINKITNPIALQKAYQNLKPDSQREILKTSPFWKDDANLIIEIINN